MRTLPVAVSMAYLVPKSAAASPAVARRQARSGGQVAPRRGGAGAAGQAQRAGEDALQRPQEQRGGDQDAGDGDRGGNGGGGEAAGEDLELGDEPGQAGQAEAAERGDRGHRGEHRRRAGQAGVDVHVVGAAPVVQHAGQQEQRAGEQARG